MFILAVDVRGILFCDAIEWRSLQRAGRKHGQPLIKCRQAKYPSIMRYGVVIVVVMLVLCVIEAGSEDGERRRRRKEVFE